jgi:hypothetical protein
VIKASKFAISTSFGDMDARDRGFRNRHCNRGLKGAPLVSPCHGFGLVRVANLSKWLACCDPTPDARESGFCILHWNRGSRGALPCSDWEASFRESAWFTRGWTLQELIAPVSVEFFSREGKRIGDKASLDRLLHSIIGIPFGALRDNPLD